MPTTISTSLTTRDTRTYVYPETPAYTVGTREDDILYTIELRPQSK
jgi:hypothetical protein